MPPLRTRLRPRILTPVALALALSGCAYDREVTPVALPAAAAPVVKRLIVTDFYAGKHQTSETYSASIVLLRESMKVRDISPEVAAALSQRGVPAIAKKSWEMASLAEGEVLLRGIRNEAEAPLEKKDAGRLIAKIILGSMTAFVVGGMISWPHRYGCRIDYRVELVTRDGDYVLSTPDSPYAESYKTYGWGGKGCDELGVPTAADESFYDALARAVR